MIHIHVSWFESCCPLSLSNHQPDLYYKHFVKTLFLYILGYIYMLTTRSDIKQIYNKCYHNARNSERCSVKNTQAFKYEYGWLNYAARKKCNDLPSTLQHISEAFGRDVLAWLLAVGCWAGLRSSVSRVVQVAGLCHPGCRSRHRRGSYWVHHRLRRAMPLLIRSASSLATAVEDQSVIRSIWYGLH